MDSFFNSLKADPRFPAYVVGFVVFVGWMLNSKAEIDEGWIGRIRRFAFGIIVGGLCGGALYAVLQK